MIFKKFCKLTTVVLFCIVTGAVSRADEVKSQPVGNNIAAGKSYKIFMPPTTQWNSFFNERNPLPDVRKVLTDGQVSKTPNFWVSNRCLNFLGAAPLNVIVDLGQEYPVGEIITHHGSRPAAGIFQPRKEEYYTSVDGKKFFKAGEYTNTFDSARITAPEIKNFFKGIKTFSSGPIKTRGRYVLVRTFPVPSNANNPGIVIGNYVGHDEIIVRKGDFPLNEAKLDSSSVIHPQLDVPEAITGYPFIAKDWNEIFTKTPLAMFLIPNSFNGSETYDMSVGGVYVICFDTLDRSREKANGLTLNCTLPDNIEVIDWNSSCTFQKNAAAERNGRQYTTYTFGIKSQSNMNMPFLVVEAKDKQPNRNIGTLSFNWHYKAGGKEYKSGTEEFIIVLKDKLHAPVPKRFRTGFWLPYSMRYLNHKYETSYRLFKFYQELGFNWADGGHKSPEIYKALQKLGMYSSLECGILPNALMLFRFDRKVNDMVNESAPFVPAAKERKNYGVCPAGFLSGKFDDVCVEKVKKILMQTHDLYENWEPYMFFKKGCTCDTCKEAFRKYNNLSTADVDKMWPGVVTDWENKQHNEFFSGQMGQCAIKAQNLVEQAAKELELNYRPSFIMSMATSYFLPEHPWNKVHNPKDFMGGIDKLIIWDYSNALNPISFSYEALIGNNLVFVNVFDRLLESRSQDGTKQGKRLMPEIYFLQTEYYTDNLVNPKDFYFTSVLSLIHGLNGYGVWTSFFKQDARYLAWNAKANNFISLYENIVMDGRKTDAFLVMQSENTKKEIIYSRSLEYNGRNYLAIGNDHWKSVELNISSKTLTGGKLCDKLAGETFNGSLKQGITVTVAGKEWIMLELIK